MHLRSAFKVFWRVLWGRPAGTVFLPPGDYHMAGKLRAEGFVTVAFPENHEVSFESFTYEGRPPRWVNSDADIVPTEDGFTLTT